MSIELHCNSCGRLLRVPKELAGKRGKCPACGNGIYIPTPEDEIQELPLAPEDEGDSLREAELQAERRRIDRILARESDESLGNDRPASASQQSSGGSERKLVTMEDAVISYLIAMRQSDLGRAERWLNLLRQKRAEALAMIDRLASDQIPPNSMSDVPAGVYQGFLKNLRAQL